MESHGSAPFAWLGFLKLKKDLSFPLREGKLNLAALRISLGGGAAAAYDSPVMTRSSIELAVQVFLVSLVVTFAWAFYQLMVLIGWW